MAVSLKTDLRFPESGQHGHGSRIIHDRRVTYIITNDGSKKCYGKLNDIERRLVEADTYFYRTHQSFLVNPKYVAAYFYDSMELVDGTTLSISENRRKKVSELFCMLKGEDIIV